MKDGKFTYYRVIFLARTRDISELFCPISLEFAKKECIAANYHSLAEIYGCGR